MCQCAERIIRCEVNSEGIFLCMCMYIWLRLIKHAWTNNAGLCSFCKHAFISSSTDKLWSGIEAVKAGVVFSYGLLTRYIKLWVAHTLGMPGAFSPPPRVSDSDMHHGTCVTHVPWCMPGSLTNGFLWSRWRGKRSRHFRCMRNPQFCVSGKRSIALL